MKARTYFAPLALLAIACSGKITSLGGVEDGTQSQDGTQTTTPEAGIGTSSDEATPDAGVVVDDDAGATGKSCNPMAASPIAQCQPDEYCRASTAGTCGIGECYKIPPAPPPSCPPLECGCDGVVRCGGYSRSLGADIGSTQCTIDCGTAGTCDGLTQYCEHAAGGAVMPDGGVNEWWTCKPIPTACAQNHSCACVTQNGTSGGTCASEKDQKITIFVPLP